MANKFTVIAGLVALFAVGSAPAGAACPVYSQAATDINDETGHTFFLYAADSISWGHAQECVAALNLSVPPGEPKAHLATITSSSENLWIVENLLQVAALPKSQVWIGGSQLIGSAEPREGWRWENSEGPIPVPGSAFTLGYSNWSTSPIEPNNTGGSSVNERHLTLGRYTNLGLWNDEGSAQTSIGGFLVEYDTPRTVEIGGGCELKTGGTVECGTVNGQTLTFPPGSFEDGDSFTFTAYEFTDPRFNPGTGRCDINRGPLTLFDDPAFDVVSNNPALPPSTLVSGKLVIPTYLCGSPKFVVIRALATDILVPRGVVVTESETDLIVPGNIYSCSYGPTIEADESPQKLDVGVWQSLDATEMWENGTTPTSLYARFQGTAAELTTACGTTLIKTPRKSNFVHGLHIDFDIEYRTPAEYNEMVELTKYKMSLVRQSVVKARDVGSISNANGRAMLSQLDNAAAALIANNPVGARKKIQDFLNKVNSSTYSMSLTNPFNFNGDHLARGENIRFTLDQKVIPFKPVP